MRQKRITAGLLFAILLLALGLRLYRLAAQSLWNDEGTSVAVAQRDAVTIARDAAQDIHPPLYYWVLGGWVRLFGTSEAAVRSLSVLLGVILVALTYTLGRLLVGTWSGLAAALLSAANPFQVAYSQEARMYMLAAALAAGAVLALVRYAEKPSLRAWLAIILLEAAGLYTHYSFAFIILTLNLGYALWLLLGGTRGQAAPWRRLAVLWIASQGAAFLLYLPWLPTALRQVTGWPGPAQSAAFFPALAETWRWLILGPTIETKQAAVPLILACILAVAGLFFCGRAQIGKPAHGEPSGNSGASAGIWRGALLVLWVVLPVALIFALGLYHEAYLKFFLVASAPVVILLGAGVACPAGSTGQAAGSSRFASRISGLASVAFRVGCYVVLLVTSVLGLRNYYTDPAYSRDDYRGIAAYVEAVGRAGDTIVLNAPGQQEVFGYYYRGPLPVYPLPQSRPLDPARTESALAQLAQPGNRVFAVLWATDESDPTRYVEGWLDSHAYKALDSWYGNVRLVVYAVPQQTPSAPSHALTAVLENNENGDRITLLGYSLLNPRLPAGDIAQITLFWQADQTPTRRYKAFCHVLDAGNHIVGQRDAEPGGGARLTTLWEPGETVIDHYGVPVQPGTPPGEYRVEVGMYDAETGERLRTPDAQGQIWLEPLVIERPAAPAPSAALGQQHTAGVRFGDVTLLGYSAYKLGFAGQPDAPLRPGDLLEISLCWRAETLPDGDWQLALDLVGPDRRELAGIHAELVPGYATSLWQAGDVWCGRHSLAIPGSAPDGQYRLRVEPLAPGGASAGVYQSEALKVWP